MVEFSARLLAWYQLQGRSLPWRNRSDYSTIRSRPDPYEVWISEVMLQQTRVESVIPYFKRWFVRFPDIFALASASEQEVLFLWEGLGYYSRARNLRKTARIIVQDYNGEFPCNIKTLCSLPGIGRYTAGAIASIAFGLDEPTLDSNVRRVLARVFNVEEPADVPAGERRLWALAAQYLPEGRAGDYNQALMDLGAAVCLPKNPLCQDCPVSEMCRAKALGVQEQRPVLKPKRAVPHYTVTAAVIQRNGKVLLAKRPSKGLLGGMWEFPGGKSEPCESLTSALRREIREELDVEIRVGELYGVYCHAYTHFRITLHAFLCELDGSEPRPIEAAEVRWVSSADLAGFPMGKVDRQIARRLTEQDD